MAEVHADDIDSIRNNLAQFLILEVVRVDLDSAWPYEPSSLPPFFCLAQQFLLLRIDRCRRLSPAAWNGLDLHVDIFELHITIRMLHTFS